MIFAHLYVENRCNLRCAHCYESEGTHPHQHTLSLADYEEIFEQLAELNVFVVTFSGGEPFLRRDFLDIVSLARTKRFAVRIYTSGTLLTPAKVERLKTLAVQEVHISIYSHRSELHDEFTGIPGSHAKSLAALRLLTQQGIRTLVKTNVMTFNIDELDQLIELAGSLGADYRIDPTVKPKMNGDRAPLHFAVSPDELRKKVLWRPELSGNLSMEEAEGICDGETPRSGQEGSLCAAGTRLITVNADGSISPCPLFPASGGNFRQQSIKSIWEDSPLFTRIRSQRFADMNECSSCEVRSSCNPCMAYGLVENGDIGSCNTSSRQYAEGKALLAGHMVKTSRKSKKGRALPIVGTLHLPMLPDSANRITTEQ